MTTNTTNQTQDSHSPPKAKAKIYQWIIGFLAPYKLKVMLALLFLLISSLAWLALGQGVRILIDQGFSDGNQTQLDQVILGLAAIVTISSFAVFGRFYLISWLGERVSADIRLTVYRALLTLSPTFYAKSRTGEVISRFTSDTTLLENVVGSSFSMALRSTVILLGGLIMMAVTSWPLTLLVLISVPVVVAPAVILGKKVRQLAKRSQDKIAELGAYVDESIHEIHTVQSYSHQSQDNFQFSEHVNAILAAAKSRIFYRALLICLIMSLSFFAILAITWAGGKSVMSGTITAGELSAFMFYAVLVAGAVGTISEVFSDIQRAAGASERLMELATTTSDIVEPVSPLSLPSTINGSIHIRDLTFNYPNHKDRVLNDITFEINAGERVALVGASGAGKSTLFALLQRFYTASDGAITLDNLAIEKLKLDELRAQFALVPQESVIFATSVLENVRYGRTQASIEEVISACKAARAHEFITEFPEGYDTYLGERGVRLSGGQKQRIAIARAILADRPVLLLDEATSALDARSEVLVKQALDTLMRGKTTLVIAHRLATVVNADRILVLDKGNLVASGTHNELLTSSEIYREFASLQLLTEDKYANQNNTDEV